MILKEKIKLNLNSALKQGKNIEVLVLRQLLAAFLNKEKEKKFQQKQDQVELTDQETIEVVSSEAKKRREAIREFEKGNRQDLVEKEKQELKVLEEYLPEQLSEQEIEKLVIEAINRTQAKQIQDMGKVMAELMIKVKGKADGELVSKIVKQQLLKND
jgi:uncharacterized protein